MVKRFFILICAIVAISFSVMAQAPDSSTIRKSLQAMVEKYDGKDNVEALECVKGSGLEMMKLMMRKEMGKDFMKGVDMIIFISYGDSSSATATEIRNEVESIAKGLTHPELPEDVTEGKYTRTFFREGEDGKSIHDMIVLIEDGASKNMIYFGGVMRDEPKSMK